MRLRAVRGTLPCRVATLRGVRGGASVVSAVSLSFLIGLTETSRLFDISMYSLPWGSKLQIRQQLVKQRLPRIVPCSELPCLTWTDLPGCQCP